MKSADIVTVNGNINFEQRALLFFSLPLTWKLLQELHHASLGEGNDFAATFGFTITPNKARQLFLEGLTGALGTFAIMSESSRETAFRSLLSHIAATRSFEGLESIFLTGMHSMWSCRKVSSFCKRRVYLEGNRPSKTYWGWSQLRLHI